MSMSLKEIQLYDTFVYDKYEIYLNSAYISQ